MNFGRAAIQQARRFQGVRREYGLKASSGARMQSACQATVGGDCIQGIGVKHQLFDAAEQARQHAAHGLAAATATNHTGLREHPQARIHTIADETSVQGATDRGRLKSSAPTARQRTHVRRLMHVRRALPAAPRPPSPACRRPRRRRRSCPYGLTVAAFGARRLKMLCRPSSHRPRQPHRPQSRHPGHQTKRRRRGRARRR